MYIEKKRCHLKLIHMIIINSTNASTELVMRMMMKIMKMLMMMKIILKFNY